ncbi:glycosyltransferase [Halobacterium hubeiense]|uniref:glycosyltransferase n=1 Tax=Halobacterium hubeiense TaxID=1407499 RepID=UPI003C74036E
MNLLQVSPYIVEPPRTGGNHRSHGLVKEFPDLGSPVVRYCQGGSPDTYRNLDFRREVQIAEDYVEKRYLNPIHDISMLPVLFGYPNAFAGRSLALAPGCLDGLIEDADVVLVREPWQVPVVLDRSDVPVVYSSHNVESERFDRMNPRFYRFVKERVHEIERLAVENSAAVVCTSERDAEMYRERFSPSQLFVAPNSTSQDNIRERKPQSEITQSLRRAYGIPDSALVAMFVGSDYGPNIEAAKHVVQIASEMEATEPPVHFLIVGTAGEAIDTELSNVTVTGFVDEFEGHFDLADVALNPMITGGGTNIKLFDYFARGLPVVSTPFGVRGIAVEDGQDVFISDLDDFPRTIRRLRAEPEKRKQVGAAARELTEAKYTWESVSRRLHSQLDELIN